MKSKLLAGAASLILVSGGLAPAHAETVTYTYDALGRLVTASTTGGATTTYTYDANGNRTQVVTTGGNAPPVANADSRSTPINTPDVFNSPKTNDTDADGGTLSITAVNGATNGTVSLSGNTVTFTPTTGFTGTGGYDYTLSDGQGGTATGHVTVTVTGGNQAPNAVNDSSFVQRNTIRVIAVLSNDTDPEGQTLTVTAATGATKGTLLIQSGTSIRYTPTDATSFGTDSFTYTISDGNGGTDTATVSLTYNDKPVAVDDTRSTALNTADVFNSPKNNDTDADGDTLSVSAVSNATGGTVTRSGSTVTFTPTTGFTGVGGYDYTLYDGRGGTDTGHVTVNVGGGNSAPVAVTDTRTTAFNTALSFDPRTNDTDANGDTLTITAKTNGAHGTVVITGGGTGVTFTPTTGYSGTDSFTYTISDGSLTSVGTVNMTISAGNSAPVAVTDTKTTAFNTVLNFDPRTNDTDANGDPLTITAKTNGANGTVAITGGGTGLSFTPTTGYSGSDSFTYTISDGALTSVGTVNMTISPSNTAPVAVDDSEDEEVYATGFPTWTYDPRANDTDANGDTLTITGVTQSMTGTVTFTGSTVTYVHGNRVFANGMADFEDMAPFTYTISDGHGGTSTATVSINIVVY